MKLPNIAMNFVHSFNLKVSCEEIKQDKTFPSVKYKSNWKESTSEKTPFKCFRWVWDGFDNQV